MKNMFIFCILIYLFGQLNSFLVQPLTNVYAPCPQTLQPPTLKTLNAGCRVEIKPKGKRPEAKLASTDLAN